MNYKNIHKQLGKRKRDDNEDNDSDNDNVKVAVPDSGWTFDKNGNITAYPANIKFVDSRAFNLDIQQEDSALIHRLVHISTGIIPIKIREQKDSITLNLLTEKDSSTNKVMSYIIQLIFPKIKISLDDITQIKLYSPDRIPIIEVDSDLDENGKILSILNITLLSSNNHIYFKSRVLYVDYSTIQHYSLNDRTTDYDTTFMKRQTMQRPKKI